MADFKFACPHCQQHISATDAYCGLQIQCPTCNGSLVVPGAPAAPAPAASAPPPVPAPPQPAGMRLATRTEPAAPPPQSAATCPSCRSPMPRGAVLCTSCGYNTVTRQKMQPGTMAAAAARSGGSKWYTSPWLYIGLLVVLTGTLYLLDLGAAAFAIAVLYSFIIHILVTVVAFKEEGVVCGLLTFCFWLYTIYFVFFKNEDANLKILYVPSLIILIILKFA